MHKLFFNIEQEIFPSSYWLEAKNDNSLSVSLKTNLHIKDMSNDKMYEANYDLDIIDFLSGLSIIQKNKSKYNESLGSNVYIFNCSCGISECVGIYNGVLIKSINDKIFWRCNRHDGYKNLPTNFIFDKQDYIKNIIELREALIELEVNNPNKYFIGDNSIPRIFQAISSTLAGNYFKKLNSTDSISINFFVDEFMNNILKSEYKGKTKASVRKNLIPKIFSILTNDKISYKH